MVFISLLTTDHCFGLHCMLCSGSWACFSTFSRGSKASLWLKLSHETSALGSILYQKLDDITRERKKRWEKEKDPWSYLLTVGMSIAFSKGIQLMRNIGEKERQGNCFPPPTSTQMLQWSTITVSHDMGALFSSCVWHSILLVAESRRLLNGCDKSCVPLSPIYSLSLSLSLWMAESSQQSCLWSAFHVAQGETVAMEASNFPSASPPVKWTWAFPVFLESSIWKWTPLY